MDASLTYRFCEDMEKLGYLKNTGGMWEISRPAKDVIQAMV